MPSIDLLVCRVYPLLHFERNGLQSNCGLASVLTESEENVRRTDLEQRRIKAMEIAIESVDVKFFEVGPESVSFITTHGTANQFDCIRVSKTRNLLCGTPCKAKGTTPSRVSVSRRVIDESLKN